MVDNALLVVGAGSTPCGVVQRAIDALGRDRVLGVVLNRVDDAAAGRRPVPLLLRAIRATRTIATRSAGLLARMLGRR